MKLVVEIDLDQPCANTARRAMAMITDLMESVQDTIPADANLSQSAEHNRPGGELLLAEGKDADIDGKETEVGTIMRMFVSPEPFDRTDRAEIETQQYGTPLRGTERKVVL